MNFFKTKKYSLSGDSKSKSKVKKEKKKKEGVVAISETEKYQVNRAEELSRKKQKKKKAPAPAVPVAAISDSDTKKDESQIPTEHNMLPEVERSHHNVDDSTNTIQDDASVYGSTGGRDAAKNRESVAESDATDFSDGHVSKELEAIANEQFNKSSTELNNDDAEDSPEGYSRM